MMTGEAGAEIVTVTVQDIEIRMERMKVIGKPRDLKSGIRNK